MSQLTPFPYIALFNPRAQTTCFRGFKKEKNEKKKAIQLSRKHKREASKEGRQGEESETRGKIRKEVGRQEKGEKRKKIKGAKKGMRARKMQRSFYNEPKLHPSFTFKSIVQILSASFVKVVCVAKGSQSVLLPRPTRVCAVLPRPPRPSKIRVETFVEARLWEHSCDWLSSGSLTGLIPRDGLRQLSPIRLKIIIQFMHITVSINFICYFKTPSCPPRPQGTIFHVLMQPSRLSGVGPFPKIQLPAWSRKVRTQHSQVSSDSPGHRFVVPPICGLPTQEAFPGKEIAFLFLALVHFILKFSVAVAEGRGERMGKGARESLPVIKLSDCFQMLFERVAFLSLCL